MSSQARIPLDFIDGRLIGYDADHTPILWPVGGPSEKAKLSATYGGWCVVQCGGHRYWVSPTGSLCLPPLEIRWIPLAA